MTRVTPVKNEKSYKCKFTRCKSSGFKTLGSKQRHEREQHRADPKCDYCDFTAKRQYQMKNHIDTDHPEQTGDTLEALERARHLAVLTTMLIANAAANTSSEWASHRSTSSRSSEDSGSSVLQHAGRLPIQHPPADNQPFPAYITNLDASHACAASNTGGTQQPMGLSYTASMYPAFDADYGITVSGPSSQRLYTTIEPQYSMMSQWNPFAQSSTVPWGAPVIARSPIPGNLPYSIPATMNPPQQLDYTFSSGNPYRSGNSRGMHYNISPYSSTSSEQGTPYSKLTGSSYIEDTRQRNNWSEQPPSKPQ
jgi:hypothetical protein